MNVETGAPPTRNWTELIDDIVAGRWSDPETGKRETVPYESIVIAPSLAGREADLIASMRLGPKIAVVSDRNTHAALGHRIEAALGDCHSIVLDSPHADEAHVALLRERIGAADGVVAVGSGTVNDLCKYATFLDERPYCVFATASSMNGYTSTTASITLRSGFKVSFAAHAPRGVFIDLAVNATAPARMRAAGLGDSLCRPSAQADWWLSHRLFGTAYSSLPFRLQANDEPHMIAHAPGIASGDTTALGYLHRVLILVGFGVSFVGTTHPGSMGEHQISHYIDSFAGARHPGTTHGEQVGVASLTMARLQHAVFSAPEPPVVAPTIIDRADLERRVGAANASACIEQWSRKALDAAGAAALNAKLRELWPQLRAECLSLLLPSKRCVTHSPPPAARRRRRNWASSRNFTAKPFGTHARCATGIRCSTCWATPDCSRR